MRNLRNIKHNIIDFGDQSAPLSASAWDPSDDSLICAFGPGETDPLLSLKRFEKDAFSPESATSIASWDAPSPNPDIPTDEVLCLHCFPDTKTVLLVLAGGDIVVVREEAGPGEDLIEIVGSVDAGVAAASWSPDEELLAIVTRAETVLFMTREFESTASITLTPEDINVSSHVSVGWGKSETQFKGRGAKAMRDPTVPEHVDEGIVSEHDQGKVSISWRGDGQYVAINSVLDTAPKRRVVRIYSREGVLESVSEPVNGLGSALSWKPSGQLIAGVQTVQDRVDVIFFERNGLRHGEFSLRIPLEQVEAVSGNIDLSWNTDSLVLAISYPGRVQLWTSSNYHWYLKQDIALGSVIGRQGPVMTSWHPEKSLHLACSNGRQLRATNHTNQVCRGPVYTPHDNGLVGVIDGQTLKITPLRTANIPPPMAFDELTLSSQLIDVAFNRSGTQVAILHDSSVTVWQGDYSARPAKRAKLSHTIPLPINETSAFASRQIVVGPEDEIMVVGSMANEETSSLISIRSGSQPVLSPLTEPVITTFARSDHDRICCEAGNGGVFEIDQDSDEGASLVPTEFLMPAVCSKTEVWQGSERTIAIGLTATGTLHIKSDLESLRIAGCTSFVVAPSHLIYTTSQHLLKFIHLDDGNLEIPPDEPEKDERCRSVERGAKLVTVMPSAYSLVLQMPRGNLETIFPRALVLAGIRASINNRDYKKAFLICRTHRVDMNILHDYAPGQFLSNIDLVVKQVRKSEYIDLILSSLSEEDVTETLYKETASKIEALTNGISDHEANNHSRSKVNAVCDAFIVVLQKDRVRHLQSIVTAHVCKNPPDLESGLHLVAELRKQNDEAQLEQAVEHICFLADVNQLYNTALGIYDLDVALLVAQQSQKDPREYLPYLQSLHDMQPLRQQFAIDNDLKRYRKALKHLHELGEFEELKIYMDKHELHSAAMELYRYDKTRLHELMALYADYLASRNRYKDAALAYEFVQDHTNAYEAYRSANMWRESLASASLVPVADTELSSLAENLAEGLEEAKDYSAAATIHAEYLDDLRNAVSLLCKGHSYAEATRLAVQRKSPKLVSEVVDPGLIEGSATMTELLAEMKSQLAAQVPRLRDLRKKKAEDPMAFLDGADGAEGDIPDNLSLAPTDASTSAGTFMTRYTNRSTGTLATNATRKTSKNRRREERKRARGKKGTVYEEEYLMNSIGRLIERLNVVGDDVGRLVEGLMRRAMRERAMAVEAAMIEVVDACRACMSEVFITAQSQPATGVEPHDESRPAGGQGVLFDAILGSKQKSEVPVLNAFERLSLLA